MENQSTPAHRARYLAKKHGLQQLAFNSGIIFKAMVFCVEAHEGQVRKYTGEEYANHPFAVAKIVRDHDGDNNMIMAALLHDVVEDTAYTGADVAERFGFDVARLVSNLTKVTTPEDGNRAVRAAIEVERLSKISSRAKTIKIADLLHNTESIVRYDKEFAKVYLAEKKLTLGVLKNGADQELYKTAIQSLITGFDEVYGIGNWEFKLDEDCPIILA